MTDPQFTSIEDVEASMAQILGTGSEEVVPVSSEPEPVPEPSEVEEPETAELEAGTITLADGTVITAEDAQRWVEFSSTLQDPRFLRAYEEAFSGPQVPSDVPAAQAPPVAPDAPQTLSPEVQYELENNPLAKMLWDQVTELRAQQSQITTQVSTVAETQQLTEQRNAYSLVNQARENFAKENGLSPDEVEKVYQATLRLYDLNRLVSLPINPLTGVAEQPDPVRRLEDAFNYAYAATPEFQERDFTRRTEAAKSESERKAKLTALSSSGSSAPPPVKSPAPTNPSDRRQALADEIAALQAGTSINAEG